MILKIGIVLDDFLLERFNFYVDAAERLDTACEPDGATNSVPSRVTTPPDSDSEPTTSLHGNFPVQDNMAQLDNPDRYNNTLVALKHRDRMCICKIPLWYPKFARN